MHQVIISCSVCKNTGNEISTKCVRNVYELYLRYVYALRSIGKGIDSGKAFSAIVNIAPPVSRVEKYNKKLLNAVTEVCESSLVKAANEARSLNDNCTDIAADFDRTWQKRGHTSLNCVITTTSFDTGKVIDFQCFSKYGNKCIRKPLNSDAQLMKQHKESGKCLANYSGTSGGKEVVGALAICSRSEAKLQL